MDSQSGSDERREDQQFWYRVVGSLGVVLGLPLAVSVLAPRFAIYAVVYSLIAFAGYVVVIVRRMNGTRHG